MRLEARIDKHRSQNRKVASNAAPTGVFSDPGIHFFTDCPIDKLILFLEAEPLAFPKNMNY